MPKSSDGRWASANAYAVLTPFVVPPELRHAKAVNLGDGFILRGIERLIGPFAQGSILTTRAAPPPGALELISRSRGLVLAGANQLNDDFAPWPGATPDAVRSLQVPLIPFGMGVHGDSERTRGLTEQARDILGQIHERIALSAWRCPLTVAFLKRELPALSDRFLMTGCPVAYDAPVLDGARFHDGAGHVAVSVTDRGDFWAREAMLLDTVADLFPKARRTLVLQQDFTAVETGWRQGDCKHGVAALRAHATRRGYDVLAPANADVAMAAYEPIDLHIGSRVHAHLLFLSRNKRSWLLAVDDRARGLARAYGFPLSTTQSLKGDLDLDFEPVRSLIQQGFETMRRFQAQVFGARQGVSA